jgi:AraC-like DNA-binding protein
VLGLRAEASASQLGDVALDEAAMLLVARTGALAADRPLVAPKVRASDRRRMIGVALWIDARCRDGIGLEMAAREAALSPYHFLRLFRAVLGVTPQQYLVRCRLRRAARLLAEGDLPVTDVALEVGFGDLSNFIRTFRRAAGVPPRDFRRAAMQRRARIAPQASSSQDRPRARAPSRVR